MFAEFASAMLPRIDPRTTVVADERQIPFWRSKLKELALRTYVSWDTETSGFNYFHAARIIAHGFGYDEGDGVTRGVYFPIRHQTNDRQLPVAPVTEMVQDILGDPRANIVGQNIKFDLLFARVDGIVCRARLDDTFIQCQLVDENEPKELEHRCVFHGVDPNAYEMKHLVKEVLKQECRRYKVKESEAPGYAWIPVPILGQYGAKDCYNTLALHYALLPQVRAHWAALYETEMRLLPRLVQAEWVGVPIDIPHLQRIGASAQARCDVALGKIHRLAQHPLNVSSDDDLRTYLYEHCRHEIHYRTRNKDKPGVEGQPSVDETALRFMMRQGSPVTPMLAEVLEWREADKLLTTYTAPIIDRCDANSVLHCSFRQAGARTGRMSAAAPNLQNIPSDDDAGIRRAFVVPRGKVRGLIDFSQIELRVLAYCASEPTMTQAFVNGEDIHASTSNKLFHSIEKRWRRISKVFNFGTAYGMTYTGIMENLNKTAKPSEGIDYVSDEQAQRLHAQFHAEYPRVNAFTDELCLAMARQRPHAFTNIFGRTRRIPYLLDTYGTKRFNPRAARQAVASMIQGTAADIAKIAIVRCCEVLAAGRAAGRFDGEFVLTVHDENQFDLAPEGAEQAIRELKAVMEDFPQFAPIPILADAEWTSTTWADKKPVWEKKK
jgi:DNA polymerase-1